MKYAYNKSINDDAVLHRAMKERYGFEICPKCGAPGRLARIQDRRAYACKEGCHIYPCADSKTSKKTPMYPNRLRKVFSYIHKNFHKEISVECLAQMTGLSPLYFNRIFKRAARKTPIQYVINLRIEEARRLLIGSELSISKIASKLGYEGPDFFIRVFKRFTGETPAAFRKSKEHEFS